jgi:hypothetical protein
MFTGLFLSPLGMNLLILSSKQKEIVENYFRSYTALSAILPTSLDENKSLESSIKSAMNLKKYGFHTIHCIQALNETYGDEKAAKDWLLLNIDSDDISPKYWIMNNIPSVNISIPSDVEMLKRFVIGGFPLNEMRYAIRSNKITNIKDETLYTHFIFESLPGFDFLREFWKTLTTKNMEEAKKSKKKCEESEKENKKKSVEKSNTDTVESDKDKDKPIIIVKEELVEIESSSFEEKKKDVKIDNLEDVNETSFSSKSRKVLLEIKNSNSPFYEEIVRVKSKYQEVCLFNGIC